MIRFFRKIRQRLVIENKFSKYLLYAIGEIALVVIGIMIALNLNIRNEELKIHQKQENYLQLIKVEMGHNLESLSIGRAKLKESINSLQQLLDLMGNDAVADTLPEAELSQMLGLILSNNIAVKYENGAMTELVASGSLKDIENDSIRGILSSWEGKLVELKGQEQKLDELWNRSNLYFESNATFRTIFDQARFSEYTEIENRSTNISNKHVLNSTKFENIFLVQLASAMHLHKGVYPRFEDDLNGVIGLIDTELNTEQ